VENLTKFSIFLGQIHKNLDEQYHKIKEKKNHEILERERERKKKELFLCS
jgi:hypothetical protein